MSDSTDHDAPQIFLALGTNLGNRPENLRQAIDALKSIMRIKAISAVYETEPWGITDQPDFLNLCLSATTVLSPQTLLAKIKEIESVLGRKPGPRWGPRLIDIDILFYDRLTLQDEHLTIPHPRLAERVFVLAPLAEIAPQLRHPQTGLTVSQMLATLDQTAVRRLPDPLFEEP